MKLLKLTGPNLRENKTQFIIFHSNLNHSSLMLKREKRLFSKLLISQSNPQANQIFLGNSCISPSLHLCTQISGNTKSFEPPLERLTFRITDQRNNCRTNCTYSFTCATVILQFFNQFSLFPLRTALFSLVLLLKSVCPCSDFWTS